MADSDFWAALDRVVAALNLVIDRPEGSLHPRHPSFRYPMDYGYLGGTSSPDGDGIDVWVGKLGRIPSSRPTVTGIIVTVDLSKRDAELKLLLNCTNKEARSALAAHNMGMQTGILIVRSDAGKG